MVELHELDKKIFDKRSSWNKPENVLNDIQYERSLAARNIYHIKTNDTLAEIAERFETTVAELVRLNDIENPAIIYYGSSLFLREVK